MFEFLFKYSRSAFDAGQLLLTSGWPLWLAAALLAAVAVLLGFSLWQQRRHLSSRRLGLLWLIQTLIAAVVVLMLWQPALELRTVRAGENAVAVMLDNSASMTFADADRPRLAQAVTLIEDQITPDLADTFNIEISAFGDQLQTAINTAELPPAASLSNIRESLIEVLDQARRTPLAAVVMASDGNDTALDVDADFWNRLAAFGVPVHTIGFGQEQIDGDIEIAKIDLAPRTLPGSVEQATVTVRYAEPGNARIRVFDGPNLIAIDETPLPAGSNEISRNIELPADTAGLQELRFEVEPDGADRVPDNNVRQRLLQVADEQRRILYFEGDPRWEYKFMRRAIHNADGLSLVGLLRTTPNKYYRQGVLEPTELANGFPQTREDLFGYDAVIIGNVESVSLNSNQQQLLHDYVAERGGSLLMLAGANALADGGWQSSPLAAALPVVLPVGSKATYARRRGRALLTADGAYSPITRLHDNPDENLRLWAEMPELADYQITGPLKPGAQALLGLNVNGNSQPLLSRQRYGRGNAFLLATSGTWRWQMQLPSEDMTHEIFWRQLLHALGTTAPQQLQLALQQQVYRDNPRVTVTANALDENFEPVSNAELNLTIKAPDGSTTEVPMTAVLDEPGRYSAEINAADTGSWQLDATATYADEQSRTTSRWFAREDGTAENFALAQDSSFLQRVASVTGGRYWPADSTDQLTDSILTASSGLTRQQTLPLWNAPIFFLLLLGLKLLEWLFRLIWKRL